MGNTLGCCQNRQLFLNEQLLQALDENISEQVQEMRLKHMQQSKDAKVHRLGKIIFIGKMDYNNKKVGYGQLYHQNNILLGTFQNNLPNGYGIVIKNYQQFYKGEFKNGLYNGKGRQYSAKHQYQGDYLNGSRKKGMLTTQFFKYHGEFKNNVFDGEGQLILKNGIMYQGHFFNGKFSGQGTITYENQNTYQGQFSSGNYEGKGKFTWANGVKFEGLYKKGKRLEGGKFQHAKQNKIDSARTLQEQKFPKILPKTQLFQVDQQKFSKISKIVRGNGTLQLF